MGRWLAPSVTADGTHLCRLRVSLTHAEEAAGLLFVVVAADRPGLEALMAHEDEKLARLTVPASRHRDSV